MSTDTAADTEDQDDLLSVTDLVRMFEEAEEATQKARKESERDRDYVDNKQLTADEIETLRKRGQPPVIDNRIKSKIDYLVGLEKTQRVKPKALPRTPVHEADAEGATEALRYVTDSQAYAKKRSAVWRNILVEGAGGISVSVEPCKTNGYGGAPTIDNATGMPVQQYEVKITRVAWDRMFADPHAAELDYSDAGYKGLVIWMDYADALAKYGEESKDALDLTLTSVSMSDTYDDKPRFNLWADRKRKRVRIVQMWIKRDDKWFFAEFTKCGILKAGPSPYVTDTGESDCELEFQRAYVDRDNDSYGIVREMISLQDGVNKRHSKSLHLLNSAQIVMDESALSAQNDIEKVRREAARPDGLIVLAPGNGTIEERFQVNTRSDLATGQLQLLQEMKQAIDTKGPNATMMGDKAGGANSASGKAIVASQQGGMLEIGDLLDGLRDLDNRVFRAVWARIRQYWTAEKWVRVTDDEQNVKWVGVNVDRAQVQAAMAQRPDMAKKIAGTVGNVAELDCDIIIDEAPDSLTPQLEQFQTLAGLKQYDQKGELPFRAIVQAAPNLKDKDKILEMMDQAAQPKTPQEAQQRQAGQQLQLRGAAAEVADKEASAQLKQAQAAKAAREASAPPDQQAPAEAPDPFAHLQSIADIKNTQADTYAKVATAELNTAKARQTGQEIALAPVQFAADEHDRAVNRDTKAKAALVPPAAPPQQAA